MNNPFDDKIKQSLENFEMPYDASAWAELEKQLPSTPPAASTGTSSIGKLAAGIALVTATTVGVWYFNSEKPDSEKPETVVETQTEEAIQLTSTEEQTTFTEAEKKVASNEVVENHVAVVDEKALDNSNPVDQTAASQQESVKTEKETQQPTADQTEKSAPSSEIDTESIKPFSAPFKVKFIASDAAVCAGEDISFMNESSKSASKLVWDFGDGAMSSEMNPTHNFALPGNYTVTLSGFNQNDLQTAEYSMTVRVTPIPTPIFNGDRKLSGYEAIPLYRFTTAIPPNETAVWSFSDGTIISGSSAEHLFRDKGTSVATLTVTNAYGCVTEMEHEYETYKDFDLLAPNTFSPNGDGINETFIPVALPEMGIAFEMTIQNPRTGEIVYRTENPSAPWDGTLNNSGQKLDQGLYVWTVVLKDNVVKNRVFNGKIQLQH